MRYRYVHITLSFKSMYIFLQTSLAGLISQNLAPYTRQIIGVDISQGMVDYYNQRVSNQGIPPEEMKAVCLELKGTGDELDGQKFDVVVVSKISSRAHLHEDLIYSSVHNHITISQIFEKQPKYSPLF